MPKLVHKFTRFEGGLNENSDARDVSQDEVVKSDNIVVDELGKVRLIGKNGSAVFTESSTNVEPGYGAFSFSTDRNNAGSIASTDWIAVVNNNDGNVNLRHTTGGSSSFNDDAIDLGGDNANVQASFYFADGVLRASDGNLSNTKNTQWRGYVDKSFFQTTANSTSGDLDGDGSSQNGTPVHYISEWTTVDSSLKKLSELNVSLALDDSSAASPDGTALTTSDDKITIAYWKADNGDWNGVYEIGVTPVYIGGQEGGMDILSDTFVAVDEKVAFQVYLSMGTSNTKAKNSIHLCGGDNRLVGINIYFRGFGSEEFYLLDEIDFLEGGKHNWKLYNADTHTAYGFFSGSLAVSSIANTTRDSVAGHYSYASTTATIGITNNASGFTGRKGFLRLTGFNVDPLYKSLTSLATQNVTVDVVNGAAGTTVITAELLDENFAVVAESAEFEYTIADSGITPRVDNEAEDPSS